MAGFSEQSPPKVSVIVPTYNRATYLVQALESIFDQTLSPTEVIVVDDGSTDETDKVVHGARGAVQYCQQEHRGIAAARNLGLRKATGEFVAWLDSDDLWEHDFLETTVSLLGAHPEYGGVYTGITFIDREGVSLSKAIRIEPPDKLYSCLVEGNWLATPTVVARRECYEAVGEFDDRFRMAEDYDMWLRLTARYRFIGVAQPLARIRVHPGNTMANVDRLCADRLALVQKHFGCLEDPSKHAPDADRGYAFAFRAMALACVEAGQGNRGWAYLSRAAGLYPRLLSRPDTFYELVCGDQPRGYRGQAGLLDIKANGTEMLARLRELFAAHPNLGPYQHQAFGLAYLALAMLSDQAGKWGQARAYLLRAIAARPLFLRDATVLRRLLKLCAGRPIVAQLRRIRRRKAAL